MSYAIEAKEYIGFFPGAGCERLRVLVVVRCAPSPGELVVYSARVETLIKPILDRYTAETGTKVVFVTDDAGPLIERLNAEGANTPADILLTVDAGELWFAAERGLLQPVESPVLAANIPANLRDPGNRWFGFSLRARTIAYSSVRVDPATARQLCRPRRSQVARQALPQDLEADLQPVAGCHADRRVRRDAHGRDRPRLGRQSRNRCLFERRAAAGGDCSRPVRCRPGEHVLLRSHRHGTSRSSRSSCSGRIRRGAECT